MKTLAQYLILLCSAFFRAMGVRSCRFHPTCSAYGHEAFRVYGFWKACAMTLGRVSRCHPFSEGGHDPVMISPERSSN